MRHIYVYAAMSAILAGLAAGLWSTYQKLADARASVNTYAETLRAAGKQRKRDAALLTKRARENAASAREVAELRVRLSAALEANRQWADQPVPADVRKALEGGR